MVNFEASGLLFEPELLVLLYELAHRLRARRGTERSVWAFARPGGAGGASVNSLHLEHFPGVTEKSVQSIETKARARWALGDVLIIHRFGELAVGEPIVMVCTAAAHRRDAFEAADFLMDFLKTEAMFWKKECRSDGESWIEPRDGDYTDAARWSVDARGDG